MKVAQIESELYCTTCHSETIHRITYLNSLIQKVECLECCRHIGSDIKFKEQLYTEMVERIGSKPYRLAKELNNHTLKTIGKLPLRMFQKPFHLAQEMKKGHNDYKKTKHQYPFK